MTKCPSLHSSSHSQPPTTFSPLLHSLTEAASSAGPRAGAWSSQWQPASSARGRRRHRNAVAGWLLAVSGPCRGPRSRHRARAPLSIPAGSAAEDRSGAALRGVRRRCGEQRDRPARRTAAGHGTTLREVQRSEPFLVLSGGKPLRPLALSLAGGAERWRLGSWG
jgi:hypothetical protein